MTDPSLADPAERATLIGDIVDSRNHPDQTALMTVLADLLAWVETRQPAIQPPTITVGDEFQAVYATLHEALRATTLLALRATGRFELRFGLGWGPIEVPVPERAPFAQSGPGWWRAREAIRGVQAHATASGWPRGLRTGLVGPDDAAGRALQAFAVCRDQVLAGMDAIDARIALGLFFSERQLDVAAELDLPQSSISRRQNANGPATLFRAHRFLEGRDADDAGRTDPEAAQ